MLYFQTLQVLLPNLSMSMFTILDLCDTQPKDKLEELSVMVFLIIVGIYGYVYQENKMSEEVGCLPW